MGLRQRIRELIGNVTRSINLWANRIWSGRPSFDWTRVDYAFYDRLWRGQARGLEKSGLLVKPIASKLTSWTLGRAPEFGMDDDQLQSDVSVWWGEREGSILRAALESNKLGDSFLLLNGDGTLRVLPPDIVHPIVADEDYSQIIGWEVRAVYPHPESFKSMTIHDRYFADHRERVIQIDGAEMDTQTFRNPLGRIPIVHIPGLSGGVNDLFGRPLAEALLELLHDYGQILDAGLDGNYRQGRPVFAMNFNSAKDLDQFWNIYGKTETQEKPDGTTESNTYLDVDLEGIVTFANANGEFKSPGSSSTDTMNYLQILYYLFLEHTEFPEFLMGSAIQGSKASAETQMPPFVKYIELMQKLSEGWILELVQLGIAYIRTVAMRRVAMDISVKVLWNSLVDDDHRLTLDTLKWAYASGLIDDENAVRLMPLEVDDPEAMLAKLRAAAVDDGDAFDDAMDQDAQGDAREMLDSGKSHYLNGGLLAELTHDDSIMVAFRVPLDVGSSLARRMRNNRIEPVPVRDMHLTLAYMGKIDDQPVDLDLATLQDAVEQFAGEHLRVVGLVNGIGRFTASGSTGGLDVLYASYDSPALVGFREDLVRAIEDAGGIVMKNHGFTPHITMAYVEPFMDMPDVYMPAEYIRFDRVSIYWGTQQIDIDLADRIAQNGHVEAEPQLVMN